MGIDTTFGLAFYKAELAAGTVLPTEGTVFLSLADGDKPAGIVVARRLRELGLGIAATDGHGRLPRQLRGQRRRGRRQDLRRARDQRRRPDRRRRDRLRHQHPAGPRRRARSDGEQIRKAAIIHRVSSVTTVEAALAAVQGMAEHVGHDLSVRSLQEYHALRPRSPPLRSALGLAPRR